MSRKVPAVVTVVVDGVVTSSYRYTTLEDVTLCVLPSRDAAEYLDLDSSLEQIGQDDQPLQEIATQAIYFLDGEHVVEGKVAGRAASRPSALVFVAQS